LSGLLRERLGIDVESERLELKRAAETAIARGRVASEKERRRLEDYAEMLEATGGDPTEIESILRLVNSR
jgi:malonyl CoA-acyl carrier protein transacylase